MARTRARGGRPSKGDRELFATRLPRPLAEKFRGEADALDVTLIDHLANFVARHYGEPPITKFRITSEQERLIA